MWHDLYLRGWGGLRGWHRRGEGCRRRRRRRGRSSPLPGFPSSASPEPWVARARATAGLRGDQGEVWGRRQAGTGEPAGVGGGVSIAERPGPVPGGRIGPFRNAPAGLGRQEGASRGINHPVPALFASPAAWQRGERRQEAGGGRVVPWPRCQSGVPSGALSGKATLLGASSTANGRSKATPPPSRGATAAPSVCPPVWNLDGKAALWERAREVPQNPTTTTITLAPCQKVVQEIWPGAADIWFRVNRQAWERESGTGSLLNMSQARSWSFFRGLGFFFFLRGEYIPTCPVFVPSHAPWQGDLFFGRPVGLVEGGRQLNKTAGGFLCVNEQGKSKMGLCLAADMWFPFLWEATPSPHLLPTARGPHGAISFHFLLLRHLPLASLRF